MLWISMEKSPIYLTVTTSIRTWSTDLTKKDANFVKTCGGVFCLSALLGFFAEYAMCLTRLTLITVRSNIRFALRIIISMEMTTKHNNEYCQFVRSKVWVSLLEKIHPNHAFLKTQISSGYVRRLTRILLGMQYHHSSFIGQPCKQFSLNGN